MSRSIQHILSLIGCGLVAAVLMIPRSPSLAQDKAPTTRQSEDAARLIAQLADKSFDVRRKARERLFEMGTAAVPALTATAQDRTKETGYSAVRILARMLREKPGGAADAARKALKKIAGGEDAMARQARESLEEAKQPARGDIQGIRRIDPFGGNLQMRVGNGRSVQVSNNNGKKTITVREEGRTVTIVEDDNITVTSDDGKNKKTYRAENLGELKKKHPEGWRLYSEYSKLAQMPQFPRIRVPQGFLAPNIELFNDPFFNDPFGRPRRRGVAPQIKVELQDAEMLLEDMRELLNSLGKKSKHAEVARMKSKLAALERNLERIHRKLDN